ncbi:MAG: dihydroorotate dehydrogenase [Eubacteriales bacterium]|jgi:dihydroorotate dehydrogenase (NAD+) catalytic subunit
MNTKVNIAGVELKNPLVTASGTFGFGEEYNEYFDISRLGAISVKGLTRYERQGNKPPRIAETPMGILNSVGLQNPGLEHFIAHELPRLKQYDTKIIANYAGTSKEEFVEMTEMLADTSVDLLEMNVSCPNVKHGGAAFGTDAHMIYDLTQAVKKVARQPLIVKLTPNVTDITEMARAARDGGADALSLINTLYGMRIDIKTRRPVLAMNAGGFSGPAVKPVAIRMVWQVANAVDLPIIGMGGCATAEDLVEFMMAGANAVAVGTALFADPLCPEKILDGLDAYMAANQIEDVNQLVGSVVPYET